MRKLVAISFVIVYLFGATEASQLLKLPVLVQHYYEHKAGNASVTLVKFLHMHYMGHDDNDDDNLRDMQLPFKTMNDCCMIAFNNLPPQKIQMNEVVAYEVQQEFTLLNDAAPFSISVEDIFQPPRLA
ncbi:MAG TPA: hypothetical protein DHW64_00375 [Chitinophagaceae bacterium]|nr:hypothetical protein [Chitinophagaceae bacterium]